MDVTKDLHVQKPELLEYFRYRADESKGEIITTYGQREFRQIAEALNRAVQATKDSLLENLLQKARDEGWSDEDILTNALIIAHCCNVVMLEARNEAWPYEYMAFSRRIGELWERFCKLCFLYPVAEDVRLYVPPLFEDVRRRLAEDIKAYISRLSISLAQREELLAYYDKVWTLVSSGQIKLELDLHFEKSGSRYAVDMKSGFSSNEKGNTNRLLLVGSIYKNVIPDNYQCLIFVRAAEELNNRYLQVLKTSGIWEVFCCDDTYNKMKEYSGFDLRRWIDEHIDWKADLQPATFDFFESQSLTIYLHW